MANAVDICNLALANLGDEATVASIDPAEGSVQAEHCARFYPIAKRLMLELHDWGFATQRASLSAYADNPREGEWAFCYALPSECIKVVSVDDSTISKIPPEYAKKYYDYEIGINEDGIKCLYTNMDGASVRYITNVDERHFPYGFIMALAWKLSGMLAGPMIKGDHGAQMTMNCEKMAAFYLEQAKATDALQMRDYQETVPPWIKGR